MPLNDRQLEILFKPLNPIRVATRQGMSYLEAWDVIAHLSRVFGPMGWDKEVSYGLIFETQREGTKTGWDVAYTAQCRLTVRDPEGNVLKVSEDVATGSAANQPIRADAHDLAIKSAVSDALKRAAKDLGNQFGLSLYDGGSTDSVLGSSLVYPPKTKPLADQLHNELPTGVLDGEDLEAARQSGCKKHAKYDTRAAVEGQQ